VKFEHFIGTKNLFNFFICSLFIYFLKILYELKFEAHQYQNKLQGSKNVYESTYKSLIFIHWQQKLIPQSYGWMNSIKDIFISYLFFILSLR